MPIQPSAPLQPSLPINSHNDDVYIHIPPAYTHTPAPWRRMTSAPPPSPATPPPTSPTSPPRNLARNHHRCSCYSWPDAIPELRRLGVFDQPPYVVEEEDHASQHPQQPRSLAVLRARSNDDATIRNDRPRHRRLASILPHHTSGMRGGGVYGMETGSRDAMEFAHLVLFVVMVMNVLTVGTYMLARYRAVVAGLVIEEAVVRVEFETRMGDLLMAVVGVVLWASVGGWRGGASTPTAVVVDRAARYLGVAVVVYLGAVRGSDGLVDWVAGRV